MGDIQIRRRKKLVQFIDANFASQKEFVDKFKLNQGEISQLVNAKRPFGENKARKLESQVGMPDGYLDKPTSNTHELEKNIRQVPLVNYIAAGAFEQIKEVDIEDYIPCPSRCSAGTFALEVEGFSMYDPDPHALKSFRPGEIIFCDPEVPATDGSLVVVRLESESRATFKQIRWDEAGNMYLKPLNPEWPEQEIKVAEPAMICGVVVGKHVSF